MEVAATEKRCFLCRTLINSLDNELNKNICTFCPRDSETIYYCSDEHFSAHRGQSHQKPRQKSCAPNSKAISDVNEKSPSTSTENEKVNSVEPTKICWPFRIETQPNIGRIMVATRDIRAGEIILEEMPAVWGPNNKSSAVCLECLRPAFKVTFKDEKVNDDKGGISINTCSKCHFPICGDKCTDGLNHRLECPILSCIIKESLPKFQTSQVVEISNGVESLVPEYAAILPIRTLQLKEQYPCLWNRVNLLMDHTEDMDSTQKTKWKETIVDFIRDTCKHSEKYSEQDVMRAIGILTTNGVNQGMMLGHGLYPTFSFISHSCQNNSRFQIYHDRRIVLRALQNISRGEEITTIYLSPLMGNVLRRSKIKNNWKFDCCCNRCKDRTELGTYVDAVLCMTCRKVKHSNEDMTNGLNDLAETNLQKREQKQSNATNTNKTNVPTTSENTEDEPYMLPKDPLEYDGQWVCSHCKGEVDGFTIWTLVRGLQAEVEAIKETNPDVIEEKLAAFSKTLHSNHFVLLTLKRRLLDLYRVLGEQEELEPIALRNRLERQVQLGKEVMGVINVLEPGLSLTRGRVLRNIHKPTLRLAKLNLNEKKITMPQFMGIAKISIQNMKESVKCMEDFDFSAMANMTSEII